MENNMFNGRVDILSNSGSPLDFLNDNNSCTTTEGHDAMSRSMEHTPVSSLFFSRLNIDSLHTGICNMVYNKSGGKYNIGRQSETELKIIMRSIYFESLKNSSQNLFISLAQSNKTSNSSVVESVKKLNKSVLDWVVPKIITNMEQFDKYKKDISTLPNPMDRPTFTSTSGTKQLELQSFF